MMREASDSQDLEDQTDYEPTDGRPTNDIEAVAAVEDVAAQPVYSDLPVLQDADLRPEWTSSHPILCIAGRSPLDEASAIMLSHLCQAHGLSAEVEQPTRFPQPIYSAWMSQEWL